MNLTHSISFYDIISSYNGGSIMEVGISTIIVIIIALILLNFIVKLSLKIIGICVLVAAVALTIYIFVAQPDMHKPFSMNTIEYLLKFNKDGSVTTTQQVTTTVIKDKAKDNK